MFIFARSILFLTATDHSLQLSRSRHYYIMGYLPTGEINATSIFDWRSCIIVEVDQSQRKVKVKFTHAPKQFGIYNYEISFYSPSSGYECPNTSKTELVYLNVPPATKYRVRVKVLNRDYRSKTVSDYFNITKGGSSFTTRTKNCPTKLEVKSQAKKDTILRSALITTFIFIVILFVILMIYKIFKSKCRKKRESCTDGNNDVHSNSPKYEKKKVFVIYTVDHKYHQKACEKIMVYLQEHCYCEVLNLNQKYMKNTNFVEIKKHVNFILFIHSEGTFMQLNAWKGNKRYPKFEDSIIYSVFEEYLHCPNKIKKFDQYVTCFMNYTDPKYVPEQLSNGIQFRIIEDMTKLVCCLHGINMDIIEQDDIPLIDDHMLKSDDGKALQKAIENATDFEYTNFNWFSDLHYYPIYLYGKANNTAF